MCRDHPSFCKSTESTLGEEVNPVVHFKTVGLSYCACMYETSLVNHIGVARGGHGRAFALPSLNIALPSKPSFYLKFNVLYIEELTWTCNVSMASTRRRTRQ